MQLTSFVWKGTIKEFRIFLRGLAGDSRTLREFINSRMH